MTQKLDQGKPRYDLLPWADFTCTDDRYTVSAVYVALKIWWTGRPHQLDLSVPSIQLQGVASVLGFGAAKYSPRGWEGGIDYSRVFAAACRHAEAVGRGEHVDSESGLAHESHFWCNVLFLLVFSARRRVDLDDRPEASSTSVEVLDRLRMRIDALAGRTAVSAAGLVGSDGKGSN